MPTAFPTRETTAAPPTWGRGSGYAGERAALAVRPPPPRAAAGACTRAAAAGARLVNGGGAGLASVNKLVVQRLRTR